MKFATLKSSDSRDGLLCVVSRDLQRAVIVADIAPTLQQALEQWREVEPALLVIYDALNRNARKDAFAFDPQKAASPLPRAYQWADGSAYVNHVELVRKARGAEMPASFWTDPLMYQGGSDTFLGPCDPIMVADEAYGIDFEAEVAVITDDVPMGVRAEDAFAHIRLFMLVNDVSLRNLIPAELAKGFGFFHSKPSSSFSPVAITPDELGAHLENARVHLPLKSFINGKCFGEPNAGVDMTFSFADLIAHAAHTRALCAGTIIGSGTVSNYDRTKGSSCIAEKRMLELLESGKSETPWLHFGDRVRIEMCDSEGQSLFGAIDQAVEPFVS
ncbi:fumarylacetoacetate hydrolase [Legionella geestiana]|uniref:Fumarylacetoacetate hydrolase n=1 Tax=Legionella geestiana TaxID=45065 RepID=A0A0W0U4R2_9GAMM|nr:fumarylacetoacetate hydrolase family protein [Legionella geestiana]KTD02888.1 fumarylacetoacetate hydrolase [Legionella geestiana]QBS11675.1 FAA hydrolase family protein [Legionella geestiana]STX53638.1 fumarylacetoacetate hydrolase [Legionella geestiana]